MLNQKPKLIVLIIGGNNGNQLWVNCHETINFFNFITLT